MFCLSNPWVKRVNLYLFDFDGTLVDSAPDLVRALNLALAKAGLPAVSLADGTRMVGHGSAKLVERALQATTGDPAITADSPLARIVLSVFIELYGPICTETSRLYPGALETLEALAARGCQLGLVTNKPREFVDYMLRPLGLDERFQVVVAGDDLATKKPAPEMVLHALQLLSVPANQACLVGDSIADLAAAQAAGVTPILVRYGYHGDLDVDASGVRVIDQLTELVEPV